jgi:hypothetical protein
MFFALRLTHSTGVFRMMPYRGRIRDMPYYFFSMEMPFLPTSISISVVFCRS